MIIPLRLIVLYLMRIPAIVSCPMDFLLTFYKYVYSLGNYFSVLVVATCVVITIRTFACDYQ